MAGPEYSDVLGLFRLRGIRNMSLLIALLDPALFALWDEVGGWRCGINIAGFRGGIGLLPLDQRDRGCIASLSGGRGGLAGQPRRAQGHFEINLVAIGVEHNNHTPHMLARRQWMRGRN